MGKSLKKTTPTAFKGRGNSVLMGPGWSRQHGARVGRILSPAVKVGSGQWHGSGRGTAMGRWHGRA
jgi:hypothetical protein